MTPIGSRLFISLNDEYLRMLNEWFFKWHSISGERAVEIDSFLGKPLVYGGIKFSGVCRVYWDTIQRYLIKKISSVFESLEEELKKYPLEVRAKALTEAQWIVGQFSEKIRRAAIEKDRILRGNGIDFPPEHDSGHWQGCDAEDIEARVEALRQIYCDLEHDVGTEPQKTPTSPVSMSPQAVAPPSTQSKSACDHAGTSTTRFAVVLTAIQAETEAVLRHLTDRSRKLVEGTWFQTGKFGHWTIAIAEVGPGNIRASAVAMRAFTHFQPEIGAFVGVAGGIKDVLLGDVVVATKVYNYESGKDTAGEFLVRPDLQNSDHELEQRARVLRTNTKWHDRLDATLWPDRKPSVHVGPIAAGEAVVASRKSSIATFLKKHYGDAIAVEMEGRGFLEAAHIVSSCRAVVIRGISDRLSGKSQADKLGWQRRAADVAATFFFEMLTLETGPHHDIDNKLGVPSPLEIIFDPANPSRRFWSRESPTDENGLPKPGVFWEYRVEIRNNSSRTLRNVSVTTEHIGQNLPKRPIDQLFDKMRKNSCDIKPGCSELVPVVRWPIPMIQEGMLANRSALEYGPVKVTASADDTAPSTRVFNFDYQVEPMLFDLS